MHKPPAQSPPTVSPFLSERMKTQLASLDPARFSRAEWRGVCRGAEREAVQQFLLSLTQPGAGHSRSQRLAFTCAAHAVLPLHGNPLAAFATLLSETDLKTQQKWADVFLEALAENSDGASKEEPKWLKALENVVSGWDRTKGETRRRQWIAFYLSQAGFRAEWILRAMPPEPGLSRAELLYGAEQKAKQETEQLTAARTLLLAVLSRLTVFTQEQETQRRLEAEAFGTVIRQKISVSDFAPQRRPEPESEVVEPPPLSFRERVQKVLSERRR